VQVLVVRGAIQKKSGSLGANINFSQFLVKIVINYFLLF